MVDRGILKVGGLTPFTTIDFPGKISAVVFCQGCPWRCSYCHNPHLQPFQLPFAQRWDAVLGWLETRRGLLEGVVFSGGEPLLQRGLKNGLAEVRAMGFLTGLHTAGLSPKRLAAVLPELDWVGFDVKGPFEDYRRITGTGGGKSAVGALDVLLSSGTEHEIRCTVDVGLLDAAAMEKMGSQLAAHGVKNLVLQSCRSNGQPQKVPGALINAVAMHLPHVVVRGSVANDVSSTVKVSDA